MLTSNCSFLGDLQEPFRWIADVAVMEAFESGVLDLPDFYFTGDDYRYRFEAEAKQRLLDLLRERFNSGVRYKGRALKWDTVIEQKTVELGRCLAGRTNELDFSEPSPNPSGTDERELRRRILGISQKEALRVGIGKRADHHLRKNTRSGRRYKVYRNVRKKLRAYVGRVTNPSVRTREGGVSFHD
jgi:CRISPR-associated protein Cas1